MQQTLPVLMYHSVGAPGSAPTEGDPLTVPAERIDDQWAALRSAGWRLMGLTEALAAQAADPSARIVAVTFDDGRDDFTLVPELLEAHDASATLYVPTAHIGGDGQPVHHTGRVLNWGELADLPAYRVEIGSHSHRHLPTDILDEQELAADVRTSRDLLEQHLGRTVVSFCYPNGYASLRQARIVADAGFENACIVGRRLARWSDDLFLIPRLQVLPEHTARRILDLVEHGEPGIVPRVKEWVHPPWRLVRTATYRTTGKVLI